ncbi:MAG: hypothetical protein IPJ32_02025 [Sphingobacteriaceae bacterium]|nr:hypothetical protein [Sphingobacteriaceae bacterium]
MASQQFDTLLVNLCYSEHEFNRSLESYCSALKTELGSHRFLDTTGVLENSTKYSQDLLKLYTFDTNFKARRSATNRFVEYISKLSDFKFSNETHIREYTINKFPLYWLTDISEKHPLHHILFNSFYFDELFEVVLKATNFKQVIFLLPRDKFFYCECLKSYFTNRYKNIIFQAVSTGTYMRTVRETLSFVRKNYKEHCIFLKEYKQQKFKLVETPSTKNIFLTYLGYTWKPEKKIDFVLNGINSVLESTALYVPLIYNWKDIKEWKEVWDTKYFKAMPGKLDWLFLMLKYYNVVKRIEKISDEHQLINNGPVSPYALKKELHFALEYKFYMLKNHVWLSNYFKKVENCNVFYQDEYYNFGRLVSHAINTQGNNRSLGFQHGMIREDHAVYALTEVEMNGKNPMPSPNYFITWGKYFQDLICKRAESLRKKSSDCSKSKFV